MPLRSFTLAEKILTERWRMDRPLLALVWLGTAAFSLAEGRWFYVLAATLAVGVNLLAVRRAMEVHLHRVFILVSAIGATVVLLIEILAGDLSLLQALGHYLILLQLCKLFQHKTNRDYVQILALSALLVVAGAMMENSLWFAMIVAGYIVLLCHTAMVFTLKRGLDASAHARLVSESSPLAVDQVAWNVARSWPLSGLRRRLVMVLGTILLVGMLVFLVYPRHFLPAGQLSSADSTTNVSGFSGTVRLDDTAGQIYQSNAVMMHVRVKKAGADATPPRPQTYLRGATYDQYRESQWSKTADNARSLRQEAQPRRSLDHLQPDLILEVSMIPSLAPNLFVSYPADRVQSGAGEAIKWPDLTFTMRQTWDDPSRQRGSLALSGNLHYTARCLSYPFSRKARKLLAEISAPYVPSNPVETVQVSQRVKDLARHWCGDLLETRRRRPDRRDELDLRIARRIAEKLSGECTYTLDLSAADISRDGVEDFLFYTKRGHCEYFASAMTVMCRVLGVRARLVTGFVMNEYDRTGGYYIVRGRDAHAWTEVFTPTTAWVTIDATPPAGREMHGQVWGKSFRRFWAELQFLWFEKVVSYDADARLGLWRSVKARLRAAWSAMKGSIRSLLVGGLVDRVLVALAMIVGILGIIFEALLIHRWLRRASGRLRSPSGGPARPYKQLKFIRQLLSLLKRSGLDPPAHQTLREFAAQAADRLHLPGDVVNDLVGLYYSMRWGQRPPSRRELSEAERQVAALGEMLAA